MVQISKIMKVSRETIEEFSEFVKDLPSYVGRDLIVKPFNKFGENENIRIPFITPSQNGLTLTSPYGFISFYKKEAWLMALRASATIAGKDIGIRNNVHPKERVTEKQTVNEHKVFIIKIPYRITEKNIRKFIFYLQWSQLCEENSR